MAIEPRQIAGMVEESMGAGGQVMPEEDSLAIELDDSQDVLPEGIELADEEAMEVETEEYRHCLLYTSPSPRDATLSRMPSSA